MGPDTALPLSPLPAVNRGLKGWGMLGELMPLGSCCAGRWPQGASTQIAWPCGAWAGAAALSRCRHSVPHTPLIAGSQIPAPGQRLCGCRPSRGALNKGSKQLSLQEPCGPLGPSRSPPWPPSPAVFSQSARAAATVHHGPDTMGWRLKAQALMSHSLEAGRPRSGCLRTRFLVGAVFLACGRLPFPVPQVVKRQRQTETEHTSFKDANPITPPNLI